MAGLIHFLLGTRFLLVIVFTKIGGELNDRNDLSELIQPQSSGLSDHWIQIADQNVRLAKESFVVRLPLFELIFLGVGMSLQLCLPGLHYFSLAETLLAVSSKDL